MHNDLTLSAIAGLCTDMGFSLPDTAVRNLAAYLSLLVRWNRKMNLVGPYEPEDILRSLVADSLHLAAFIKELPLAGEPECWDLGAGAGLPGLPLRMLWQAGSYTLVEAREKRSLFLQTVLASCPLAGTTVFRGRAEAFMPTRPKADLIVSRAFMPWEKMLAFVEPFLSPQGFCVFLALEPAPEALPPGWRCHARQQYAIINDCRYFWALSREGNAALNGTTQAY